MSTRRYGPEPRAEVLGRHLRAPTGFESDDDAGTNETAAPADSAMPDAPAASAANAIDPTASAAPTSPVPSQADAAITLGEHRDRIRVTSTSPVSDTADQVVGGNTARAAFGVDGTGIKVGIISDSFNVLGGAATDEQDGALPPANMVTILKDAKNGADEGRAMAEIVHSIAPGAQIAFYTSGNTAAAMAKAIAALRQAGCQIIVDDITFLDEPFYQEGDTIATAIDAAVAKGSSYFTAAGNASTNSYYEGTFNPVQGTNSQGQVVPLENFGTAANPNTWESVTIPKGAQSYITLQWNQPYLTSLGAAHGPGSANSLGFNLVNAANNAVVSSGLVNEIGGDPIQLVSFKNNTGSASFKLQVFRNAAGGPTPGLFKIIMDDDSSSPVVFNGPNAATGSGNIYGHEIDPNAITVGAVPEQSPTTMENFSSIGPGEFLFDQNGNPLPAPVGAGKVNVVAPDGNNTTDPLINPFYGTSAAAPAAAAVGALMLQERPALLPTDIADLLEDTATPIAGNAAVTGAGLVNASAAVALASTLVFDESAGIATLLGTHLNDVFVGGPGSHSINGEGGGNTLDYSAAPGAVTINLATGIAANGFGGTDAFSSFQIFKGSAQDDTFIAGNQSATLFGGGGHDTLQSPASLLAQPRPGGWNFRGPGNRQCRLAGPRRRQHARGGRRPARQYRNARSRRRRSCGGRRSDQFRHGPGSWRRAHRRGRAHRQWSRVAGERRHPGDRRSRYRPGRVCGGGHLEAR
jgi:hypothetical protein